MMLRRQRSSGSSRRIELSTGVYWITGNLLIHEDNYGIPEKAKDDLRRALATDNLGEFRRLVQRASEAAGRVGRCPTCYAPPGADHYCHRWRNGRTVKDSDVVSGRIVTPALEGIQNPHGKVEKP